jgi:RNA-splicing ligase RtcB
LGITGYGFPIGGVAPRWMCTNGGVISPGGIGFDIPADIAVRRKLASNR